MQFDLNEEQLALAESLVRLLDDHYGFEKRRAIEARNQIGRLDTELHGLPVPIL